MLSRNCCIPWRVGANDYQVKMGSKTKTYHVNILKKYIAREPDTAGNVVFKCKKDSAILAVAVVIHQILTQSWKKYQI